MYCATAYRYSIGQSNHGIGENSRSAILTATMIGIEMHHADGLYPMVGSERGKLLDALNI